MKAALVVSFVALGVSPVLAQTTIYTWVDKQGVTHFTDSASNVPKDVAVETTVGNDLSYSGASTRPVTATVAAAAPTEAEKVAAKNEAQAVEAQWRVRFAEVRNRIAELTDLIEVDAAYVERGLPVTGSPLVCPSPFVGANPHFGRTTSAVGVGLNVGPQGVAASASSVTNSAAVFGGPAWGCFPNPEFERRQERLSLSRRSLNRAKAELEELEREAAYYAVPFEWRR